MSQSLTSSTMELSLNQKLVESLNLPSITNSTYGIKGHIAEMRGIVDNPSVNGEIQVKIQFKTSDKNGTGYLDYFILGFPFSSLNPTEGIYYNFNNTPFALEARPSHMIWDISEFFGVKDITSSVSILTN